MLKSIKCLVVLAVVLFVPGLAFAQGEAPKWSYVEGGFIDFDPDEGLSDDGWFAGGSFALFKNFQIVAEYQDIGEYTFWNVGGGWHGLLGDPADLFANIRWTNVTIDENDIDDDGYDLEAGLRWKLAEWFELNGNVTWVDYGDAGDDTTVGAGVIFSFLNDKMGVGASYDFGDANTAKAFFRFNFGK